MREIPITVIPFSSIYTSAVIQLILSIQQAEYELPITVDDQPDLQDIVSFYQHGVGNFWVALHKEQVVGTIALLDIGSKNAALRKMFVAEPFRGVRHGTAKHLLNTLLNWACSHNVHAIYLGTTDRFIAAHRFYEKHDFTEIAIHDLPASFPLMAVDSKFYRYIFGEASQRNHAADLPTITETVAY